MTSVHRLLDPEHAGTPPRSHADLVDLAERAGLRGRGGGGFPVARKLRAARESPGRPVVVVNAAEGEPASAKDRTLLDANPHLVLEGAEAAAHAVGASEVVLAVHRGGAADHLRRVIGCRPSALPVRLVDVEPSYVAGEASAVVSAATGGAGLPSTRRAPLAVQGPRRRPWLVQNAETVAGLALLARYGLDWFAAVGVPGERGTRLLTVRGAVQRAQVVEVPVGAPLGAVLAGATESLQAVLAGGYAGRWLAAPRCLDLPLSVDALRVAGGTLGAGVVIALPHTACGLATTARIARYLAEQSARQCGPCLNGLPALASVLEQLAAGAPPPGTLDRLARWCAQLPGRGACSHPDGAVALVRSALHVFADDVRRHHVQGCGRPALELPT